MREDFREHLNRHERVFAWVHVERGLVADETVAARVAAGDWLHPYPRVYVASPALTPRMALTAALAYADPQWAGRAPGARPGEPVAFSCATAAAAWRLRWGGAAPRGELHLTTSPKHHLRDAAGLVIHRSGLLLPRDVVMLDGLPYTPRARTLIDLARYRGHGSWSDTRAAWCHVVQTRRLTVDQLECEARATGYLTQPRFTALVADLRGRSESELECQFGEFRRRFRFPAPTRQVWMPRAAGGWARVDAEVDGVLVELLGLAVHLAAGSLESDIERRNDLNITLAGTNQICQEITYDAMRGDRAAVTARRLWLAVRTARRLGGR